MGGRGRWREPPSSRQVTILGASKGTAAPPPTARPLLLQNRAHGHFCLGGTGGDYEAVRFPPARDETGVARRRERGAGVGWTELGGGPNWDDRPYIITLILRSWTGVTRHSIAGKVKDNKRLILKSSIQERGPDIKLSFECNRAPARPPQPRGRRSSLWPKWPAVKR